MVPFDFERSPHPPFVLHARGGARVDQRRGTSAPWFVLLPRTLCELRQPSSSLTLNDFSFHSARVERNYVKAITGNRKTDSLLPIVFENQDISNLPVSPFFSSFFHTRLLYKPRVVYKKEPSSLAKQPSLKKNA